MKQLLTDDVNSLFAIFDVKEDVQALSSDIASNEFAAIPENCRRGIRSS
ncbi:hypothetical protein O9929_25935 [Vibrio lentus]|nr:hypothetical protein [Vibrio lentus]